MFKTKIRKIGTSMGILIPKEILERENLVQGENVDVSVFNRRRKLDAVMKLFGTAKGSKPFARDRTDRLERY